MWVMGAGMHGYQVTEPHPCPGKHGSYFPKKKKKKKKKKIPKYGPGIWVHYTQDLKKKGYIFQEQSLKIGTFSCQKITPNNGYEFLGSSRTPRQTQMRVCHPTLFPKLRALTYVYLLCDPPRATEKINDIDSGF